jgi:hypothetical protein
MDKELFKQRLKDIGSFKKRYKWADPDGHEDFVFQPAPTPPTCPQCHTATYWPKMNGKGIQVGWIKRCGFCKGKTVVIKIVDK